MGTFSTFCLHLPDQCDEVWLQQAPGALNDDPASAKQSPTRLMHRVRHELDAIAALNKEVDIIACAKLLTVLFLFHF